MLRNNFTAGKTVNTA